MITKEELKKAINDLGMAGKDVWVNSALRSFGDSLENGADGLIDAFLECGCTLMAPSFNWYDQTRPADVSYPQRNAVEDEDTFNNRAFDPSLVFDRNSNRMDSDLGILPRTLTNRPDRARGGNAITAFAAVGPDAHYLVDDQDDEHPYIPFDRFYENDGVALLIGVGLRNETMIHLAEQRSGRNMLVRWVFQKDGSIKPVTVSSCSHGYTNFDKAVEPFERRAYVGKSLWRVLPARQLIDTCEAEIRKNPMITKCDDPDCAWCRAMIPGGPIF